MLRAVTNRDFPMLRQSLKSLFGMELDIYPLLSRKDYRIIKRWKKPISIRIFRHKHIFFDPKNRIRIIFINTEDLSFGLVKKADITGRSIPSLKLVLIGIPKNKVKISKSCRQSCTKEGYLCAITLHEIYELLTGDFEHCNNPNRCINSLCNVHDVGTCSACMGVVIDEKFKNLTLEDLYCPEHLHKLKQSLTKWNKFD